MTHTWEHPETIYYKAKKVFEEQDKALLCAVWCMAEQGKTFEEIGNQLGVLAIEAIEAYDKADYMRLEDWEFREKTNELLNE